MCSLCYLSIHIVWGLGTHRQRWMPFRPPFLAAGERFVENKMSCSIKLISLLFYWFLYPRLRALGQPMRMAAHTSDWGNSLNRRRRGANGTPWWWWMWGELCCCLTDYLYYSYRRKSTGWEFFVPAQTLKWVKLYKKTKARCHRLLS